MKIEKLSSEIAIDVLNYTKRFKKFTAVDNISLSISKGSFHAICGENGSGKTTLVRAIIGSYSSSSYSGLIRTHENASISYIPEIALFPSGKSVRRYLLDVAHFIYEDNNKARLMVDKSLADMGISHLFSKNPSRLSSGQKKKVLLAKIYIENPDIVILDEPTANLDFNSRDFVFQKLLELNKEGKTIIIISHLVKEIEEYVNEFTLIHYGKLIRNQKIKSKTLSKEYEKGLLEQKELEKESTGEKVAK